jgi:hypothetical protein
MTAASLRDVAFTEGFARSKKEVSNKRKKDEKNSEW